MKRLAMVLFVAAGCAPQPAPDAPPIEDGCGAASLQAFVGQDSGALPDHDGPIRIIPPGSPVTMDYREDRLNVDLDDAGKITRIWCG